MKNGMGYVLISISQQRRTLRKISKLKLELIDKLVNYGCSYDDKTLIPKVKTSHCGAELANSFLIDQVGDIYKCNRDLGVKENAICNIEEVNKNPKKLFNQNYLKWVNNTPLRYDKCKKCELVFSCQSGCPHEKTIKGKSPQCRTEKYNLDELIKYVIKKGAK
jgi:radical SAM protein with 4Fe4S-binding SPASM domain